MKMLTIANGRLLFQLLTICSLFLTSCSKDVPADPIALAKANLVGPAISPNTWRLVEVRIDGNLATDNSIVSSNAAGNYLIRFYQGGSFLDSDGIVGKWDIPNTESLTKSYTNLISGVEVIQSFFIEQNDGSFLRVKYTDKGKVIQLSYVTTSK